MDENKVLNMPSSVSNSLQVAFRDKKLLKSYFSSSSFNTFSSVRSNNKAMDHSTKAMHDFFVVVF